MDSAAQQFTGEQLQPAAKLVADGHITEEDGLVKANNKTEYLKILHPEQPPPASDATAPT